MAMHNEHLEMEDYIDELLAKWEEPSQIHAVVENSLAEAIPKAVTGIYLSCSQGQSLCCLQGQPLICTNL